MVPTLLYTSWKHNPGEMRLYMEGQEVVNHRALAPHYRHQWREYWRAEPPLYSSVEYEKDRQKYERLNQANKYRVGNGVPTNDEEYQAVLRWADPDLPRREFYNRAGNQYSP